MNVAERSFVESGGSTAMVTYSTVVVRWTCSKVPGAALRMPLTVAMRDGSVEVATGHGGRVPGCASRSLIAG